VKLRQLTNLIFAFVVIAFTKAHEVASKLVWPVAQDVTYCCGNHKPSHCGRANELPEFERRYGWKNWKVERRTNEDDASAALERSDCKEGNFAGSITLQNFIGAEM
jgi:hypothetical protein